MEEHDKIRVKICGLRREEDVSFVNAACPDYTGFIFASGRRRSISPAQAGALSRQLTPSIVPVGVFVDAGMEDILPLVRNRTIRAVQLHGQESEAFIRQLQTRLKEEAGEVPVIRAVSLTDEEAVRRANATCADVALLDSGPGGTGQRIDPALLAGIARPFWLAGGLSPANIGEALTAVRALACAPHLLAVDTSSGTETDGVKDAEKIKAFVQAVRRLC